MEGDDLISHGLNGGGTRPVAFQRTERIPVGRPDGRDVDLRRPVPKEGQSLQLTLIEPDHHHLETNCCQPRRVETNETSPRKPMDLGLATVFRRPGRTRFARPGPAELRTGSRHAAARGVEAWSVTCGLLESCSSSFSPTSSSVRSGTVRRSVARRAGRWRETGGRASTGASLAIKRKVRRAWKQESWFSLVV